MQTYGSIIPGGPTLARLLPAQARAAREPPVLSRQGRVRLAAVRWHEPNGRNVRRTADHFGFSRSTIYAWLGRYEREGLRGLEDRSRRPHRVRQPLWQEILVETVRQLRDKHPRWGKDKLVVLVRQARFAVSVSMVGRILTHLKKKGLIRDPGLRDPWIERRAQIRPYAVRKPRDYIPREPGDLVQIDSADIRLLPGSAHWYKHFTARDVVSRWDVLGVYGRATAITARDFLEAVIERMPSPVKAIQG
jgi:putative transposase